MADRQGLAFHSSVQPDRRPVIGYLTGDPSPAGKERRAPTGVPSFQGTKLVRLTKHADSRGCLIALDREQSLPFEVRRVFCMYEAPRETVRGEHATSAHLALVALQGAVEVDLDNGRQQATIRLARIDEALCVHAGVWLRLRNFADGTIVLVAASQLYRDVVYFDRPNLELLKSIAQAGWR